MTVLTPQYLQPKGYTAKQDRQVFESIFDGEGVMGTGDLKPATSGTLTMTVAAGECTVRGDTNADQGLYHCRNDASVTKTHAAHHATLPRVDQVVMHVYDTTEAGGVSNLADLEILQGGAAGGATLDNRTGVASLPASALLIADVLVPATAGAITLRDRRAYAVKGPIPQVKTVVDMVSFEPNAQLPLTSAASGVTDTFQNAALFYLPRRIVNATRMRWKYTQGSGTALTGNYHIGIYDSSGNPVCFSGSVAFTGAINTLQVRSESFSAQTFEAGLYYIWFGVNGTNAGTIVFNGLHLTAANSIPSIPNVLLFQASGGITAPTNILGFTDMGASAAASGLYHIPLIALSVG